MKKILAAASGSASTLLATASAFAQTINLAPPAQALPADTAVTSIPQFIVTFLFVIGIIAAVVFLIYGGIKWILSGGDEKKVEAARNHIIAAVVGLIIIVAAFFIINIVFTILTGKPFSLNNLCIPTIAGGGTC